MKFRQSSEDEPEINLIPFIDVLLVILIFLMLSTTYSRFTELQVTLPVANADATRERPAEIIVSVAADGRASIDKQAVEGRSVEILALALRQAASERKDPVVIISADANAAHQSVVNVLDAARRVGLARITFAAQVGQGSSAP
ncbi:ExbD/TolR family protein [Ideonella paludis]|uniref:Biopolymer transporter ExbD n=1 Tax=Ideonella paludis TaxID=1233411 RepID=A0ABS5DUJ0_9BURK|nr:biopolymer transporter ExbD [Ideonella paludis]MBQ0934802.1 biopolymer transporter ExbD [Ideonella paludis]